VGGSYDRYSKEFTFPYLEPYYYKAAISGIPIGFEIKPGSGPVSTGISASSADVDISGASPYFFTLQHEANPSTISVVTETSVVTGTAFAANYIDVTLTNEDGVEAALYYQLQASNTAACTAFTDVSPAPVNVDLSGIAYGPFPLGGVMRAWRLRAVYAYDKGPWTTCETDWLFTPAVITAPTEGKALGSATTLTVSWTAFANGTATGTTGPLLPVTYFAKWSTDGVTFTTPAAGTCSAGVTTPSCTITGITTGTYYVYVYARDAASREFYASAPRKFTKP
jgi:hypothetical protein